MGFLWNGSKKRVGLDISLDTINLVEIGERKGELSVQSIASTPIVCLANQSHIIDAINTVKKMSTTLSKCVNSAIDDNLTKVKKITLDKNLSDYEVELCCQKTAHALFPISPDPLLFDYQVISTNDVDASLNDIVVIAVDPCVEIESTLKKSPFSLSNLETKLHAFQRIVLHIESQNKRVICYVHRALKSTFLVVIHDGSIIHTEIIAIHQDYLTALKTYAIKFDFQICFVSGMDAKSVCIKPNDLNTLKILPADPFAYFKFGSKINADVAAVLSNRFMLALGLALK